MTNSATESGIDKQVIIDDLEQLSVDDGKDLGETAHKDLQVIDDLIKSKTLSEDMTVQFAIGVLEELGSSYFDNGGGSDDQNEEAARIRVATQKLAATLKEWGDTGLAKFDMPLSELKKVLRGKLK